MYHVELRKFPHNTCRFNLTEQELMLTILGPWVRDQWLDVGEREWNSHEARLTVIEGPHLDPGQLSMGRGWRVAQREGQDVTERVIAAARKLLEGDVGPAAQPTAAAASDSRMILDSLGLELLSALGADSHPLSLIWRLAAARRSELVPAESLALAEAALRSLLDARLVLLAPAETTDGDPQALDMADAEALLRDLDSWSLGEGPGRAWLRRA